MKNFELIGCKRSDCRFTITDTFRTAGYTAPVFDKYGNDITVDLNISTGKLSCSSCERKWKFTNTYDHTHYEEIK